MNRTERASRKLFAELVPGDKVQLDHEIKVGQSVFHTQLQGTVVKAGRRRQGLHFARNQDDKVYSDILVLKRDDGELTTVTMDAFTVLKKLAPAESPSKE